MELPEHLRPLFPGLPNGHASGPQDAPEVAPSPDAAEDPHAFYHWLVMNADTDAANRLAASGVEAMNARLLNARMRGQTYHTNTILLAGAIAMNSLVESTCALLAQAGTSPEDLMAARRQMAFFPLGGYLCKHGADGTGYER